MDSVEQCGFVFKIISNRINCAHSFHKDRISVNYIDQHRRGSIVFMEISRMADSEVIVGEGVTSNGVPLGGELGSSGDVVSDVTPGSIAELKKFIADCYFIDLSSAAAGYELRFGHIEYLLSQGNAVKVTGDICTFCLMRGTATTKNVVHGKIRKHNEDMKTFRKAIPRCWHLLKPYLERIVPLSPAGKKRHLQENSESDSEGKKLKASNDAAVQEQLDSVVRQCPRCITQRQNFASHCENLNEKLKDCRKAIRLLSKRFNTRRLNQEIIRKATRIANYRQEKTNLKSEIRRLKNENQKLFSRLHGLKDVSSNLSKWKKVAHRRSEQRQALKDNIQSLNLSVEEAKLQVDELAEKLSDNDSSQSAQSICHAGIYDAPFRKCLYACLESQVPVEKAGHLVSYILSELAQIFVSKIPAPSTVAQMAYEMGIISNLQVAEALYTAPELVATLAWDATTIDGVHFNEVNLSFGGKTFTLEVGKLGGGSTLDYLEHIVSIISNLGTTFSTYSGIQQHLILHKFKEMFQATLTDRAPVNGCVSQRLSELFTKDLIVLHCNLHPLDGLATEAKKVLKRIDAKYAIASNTFGNEGRAANLILAVSKLRYKATSGDPSGFKTFLKLVGQKVGVITRYVGNRLHILFHSAGIIIHLKDDLLQYLKKYSNKKPFQLSLTRDLQEPKLLMQLRVLGLFGKMLTGPWMTLFYQNDIHMKHLEMVPHVKVCLDNLKIIVDAPENLLSKPTNCFGQALDTNDDVLRSLRKESADEVFYEITRELAEGFCKVLKRQLSSYLDGPLSNPDEETVIRTSEAPLHNMHSERALGMFDFQCHRAHNATVGFRDGKVKFVMNKTMTWLKTKPVEEQWRIVCFARRFAAKRRREMMAREIHISNASAERLKMMAQRRDNRQRSQLEKAIRDGTEDFTKIPPETKADCDLILAKSSTLIGRTLQHVWTDDQGDTVFEGKVVNIQGSIISILYSSESEATELSVYELVADIILGDASFLSEC